MSFRSLISGIFAAGALASLCLAIATPAFAHAHIADIQWDDSVHPTKVIATSDEDDISTKSGTFYIQVFNNQGQEVDKGDTAVSKSDPTMMSVSVQPNLPPGGYLVKWTTVSADDGDEDDGTFTILITQPPALPAPAPQSAPAATTAGTASAAAAAAPAAPRPAVQVPSTGDAGLLSRETAGSKSLAVFGLVGALAMLSAGGLVMARRRI